MTKKSKSQTKTYPAWYPDVSLRRRKRRNIGAPSLRQEYGATPNTAIAELDKQIENLKNAETFSSHSIRKNIKEKIASSLSSRIATLENIKRQAQRAISFIDYESGLIIPNVINENPNPDDMIVNYYGDLDERKSISAP